jgi:hypothetical protein
VLIVKKPLAARATAALDGLLPALCNLGVTTYFEPVVWKEMERHLRGFGDKMQPFQVEAPKVWLAFSLTSSGVQRVAVIPGVSRRERWPCACNCGPLVIDQG